MIEMTLKTGRRILDRVVVPAEQIDSQVTVWSFMYGGAYGQVNWNDGKKPIKRPRVFLKNLGSK